MRTRQSLFAYPHIIIAPLLAVAAASLAAPAHAAPTDEIQVYTGDLEAPGKASLTLHDNYIANGSSRPEFPGGLAPDHAFNGVAEWAYGVTDYYEAGMYLPLYSDAGGRAYINGAKLRALFAVPDAGEKDFFYGVNFELSYNARHWDPSRWGGEIRPIIGWRFGPVDLVINPIVDTTFDGVKNLEFVPATRLAYNFSKQWAVAAEEYDDFGPLKGFLPSDQQQHSLFAVADYSGEELDVEGGIGFGMTSATDQVVLKLIVTHEF